MIKCGVTWDVLLVVIVITLNLIFELNLISYTFNFILNRFKSCTLRSSCLVFISKKVKIHKIYTYFPQHIFRIDLVLCWLIKQFE